MQPPKQPTREAKIGDIRRVWAIAKGQGDEKLKVDRYCAIGGIFSRNQIFDNGDTWSDLCDEAGAPPDIRNEHVSDDTYFHRLKAFVGSNGRLPKTREFREARLNFKHNRWSTSKIFFRAAVGAGAIPESLLSAGSTEMASSPAPESAGPNEALPQMGIPRVPPPPVYSRKKRWERIQVAAHPYAPHHEQGVVAIFAILCAQRVIPWHILTLNSSKGIDASCTDENGQELRVEFKRILSRRAWNHDLAHIDCVICWRNDWPEFPKRVIELAKLVSVERPDLGL